MEVWKGEFMYDEEHYGHNDSETFELHVHFNNGPFIGTSEDSDFRKISNEPIHVEGFINGDHIQFTKSYPFQFEADENGKTFIDKSAKGHQVIYDGYFDPIIEKWTGDWEVETNTVTDSTDTYNQIYIGGTWELNLPFDSFKVL
ncbi:MAG: hypothetical protein ACPGVI_04255 [Crocinitomicaceae bacterium]